MTRALLLSIAALSCTLVACGSATAPEAASAPPAADTSGGEAESAPEEVEAPKAESLDPVAASPDVYKVILDGERMRVIEATWQPGQRDNFHGHPALVAYALTDIFGIAYEEDESQISIRIKKGRGLMQSAVTKHAFENRGKEAARLLLVEFKPGLRPSPLPRGAKDAQVASPDIFELVAFDTRQRVLLGTWQPGQQDEPHGHAALAVYAVTDVVGELTDAEGKVEPISLKAGTAMFHDAVESHQFKNTGSAPAQLLLFEARK